MTGARHVVALVSAEAYTELTEEAREIAVRASVGQPAPVVVTVEQLSATLLERWAINRRIGKSGQRHS